MHAVMHRRRGRGTETARTARHRSIGHRLRTGGVRTDMDAPGVAVPVSQTSHSPGTGLAAPGSAAFL